eukprot:4124577-Pleurochrysis_carterae.AAC.1
MNAAMMVYGQGICRRTRACLMVAYYNGSASLSTQKLNAQSLRKCSIICVLVERKPDLWSAF